MITMTCLIFEAARLAAVVGSSTTDEDVPAAVLPEPDEQAAARHMATATTTTARAVLRIVASLPTEPERQLNARQEPPQGGIATSPRRPATTAGTLPRW